MIVVLGLVSGAEQNTQTLIVKPLGSFLRALIYHGEDVSIDNLDVSPENGVDVQAFEPSTS